MMARVYQHAVRLSAMVLLAAVSCGSAVAQKKYGPGVTDTEIKIGQTKPYSGPASAYGTIGRAEAAYFDMINEQGGINGRKINFISLDDGYSPPRTVEQMRKLVEEEQVLFSGRHARHADQHRDPQVREREEGPAPLRRTRARPSGATRRTSRGPWASI